MRLKIVLECDSGTILPFNYNYHLFTAVSRAIYKTSTSASSRGFGLFTFSQLYFDQYSICPEGINNQGKIINWYISSPKLYFLEELIKGFKNSGYLNISKMVLPIKDIEVLATPEIGDEMEFSCMSPITVTWNSDSTEGWPRYGRLEDSFFAERLRQDLINKYYKINECLPSDESLKFEFNQRYLDNKRRVSRLIDFNGIKIMGYMIPFKVKGNSELIRLGYQLGFGSRNNYGFGMVKIWYSAGSQSGQDDGNEED